ncbi:flagellar biosynthesis protein FlhB [Salipiger aestuarii]|uniref:Flagellar biosynthetic protein FlhB n=1 Tax=Salipiger aestuarii TaxID=568098 RepID=A0A327YP20_9RHOB|nr:EscU/YscU/HrcU family type III secretion system export apparatus switch protein [Salipiger aestuarii]EIE52597.1 flagellar biosynthesis protein FlhB [Citreicella sp. 357]KAA8609834.1 flagellar biosynthesis protein FlhB [Salipiger aestuarii]KAB2543094.1 flagellar biosynthesis protein FlhB [Salipiger aestuarii]RAK21405.1 flagellar biosynthetic protein FlhB [Salipiger aestuarii]
MAEDEGGEKSHEASQRKLDDARKKGEIPRSPDMLTASAYLGMLVTGVTVGGATLIRFADTLMPMIEQPDRLERLFFSDMSTAPTGGLMTAVLSPVLLWLSVPALSVLLVLLATRGLLFTPSKLELKFNRLSPIENAKNKFGRRGLFEFAKSFAKLTLYSVVLGLFLSSRLDEIAGVGRSSPREATALMGRLMLNLLAIAAMIAISLGAVDFLWQRAEHMRRNRMSQKELRDEYKESEGDPMFKQHRRARAQEIAMNQMMTDVPKADVIIVNPTHYAVALSWSRMKGEAPVCVAKGVDEIALRIREIAEAADVPIHSDPPTARAVHATTQIGDQIAPEHFRPVAAAIRFAEDMRKAMRKKKGYE